MRAKFARMGTLGAARRWRAPGRWGVLCVAASAVDHGHQLLFATCGEAILFEAAEKEMTWLSQSKSSVSWVNSEWREDAPLSLERDPKRIAIPAFLGRTAGATAHMSLKRTPAVRCATPAGRLPD